jgi:hypothetical protein
MMVLQLFFLNYKIRNSILRKPNLHLNDLNVMKTVNAGLSICLAILFSAPFLFHVQATLIGESNSVRNPFSPGQGPPEIVIINNNTQYMGELRNYIWRAGDVNDNIPVIQAPRASLNASLFSYSGATISIDNGSEVTFAVKENPAPEAQPDAISVNAYTLAGQPVKVLSVSENKRDTFRIDLPNGEYILMAIATWLPDPNRYLNVEGYVKYVFKVNVIN